MRAKGGPACSAGPPWKQICGGGISAFSGARCRAYRTGAWGKHRALHWTDSLPKTRSGKIMRRILRKIAAGDTSNLGDTSTLADPGVVEKLLEEKQAIAMPS